MKFDIALKTMVAITIGFVYWFWAFLVFMVYAFMPISKMGNSIIFAVAAPVLYLALSNWIIGKLFKDTGWKKRLINFGITIGTMLISIVVIDVLSRMVR